MNDASDLSEIEKLFLALANKTRLRILNLMRPGEVCVNLFSAALGVSQPKVSRHLAYMRNAGLVEARRDGKWIYYGIKKPADPYAGAVLSHIMEWVGSQPQMAEEHRQLWGGDKRYTGTLCEQKYDNIFAEANMTKEEAELEIYLL